MYVVAYVLAAFDAVVITLLLRTGAAKLVSPGQASAAVGELLPARLSVPVAAIRALAVIELTAAIAIAVPWLWFVAQVVAGLLGVAFAVAGALGEWRGSSSPCGCFGSRSSRPLGTGNILLGLAFLASAALHLAMPGSLRYTHSGYAALFAVVLSAGWLLFTHRGQARLVIGNVFNRSEVTV
jgi:hypothetical protein